MKKVLDFIRKLDPKLVVAGVTFALTYAAMVLMPKIGIHWELRSTLIPGYYLTVGQGISLGAAAVAGWFKDNAASRIRREHEERATTPPPPPPPPATDIAELTPLEAPPAGTPDTAQPTAPTPAS